MKIALRDPDSSWAPTAADFLRRGPDPIRVVEPADADVVVGDGGDWTFTDRAGVSLTESTWVRAAVAGYLDSVEIQLRCGRELLASGRVGLRRTVRATEALAMRTAGPLIEMAIVRGGTPQPSRDEHLDGPPGRILTAVRAQGSFAGRLSRASVTYRQWGIARLQPGSVSALLEGAPLASFLRWNSPAPNQFWADPTVVCDESGPWVFVEELDRRTGKGHIRALRIRNGAVEPGPVVLDREHHVSYPQIRWVDGRWVASVETCGAANPIMTCDRLGDPWRPVSDLPPLPSFVGDPSVEFDDDGLPARVLATDAGTDGDAVSVQYIWSGSAWQRVPEVTYVDVRSARGGGTSDRALGVRAVQDCARTYGRGLRLVPVDWQGGPGACPLAVLDGPSAPPATWPPAGIHTMTWTPDQSEVWIDGWRRHVTALGGYHRVVERRHLASCSG